MHKYVFLLILNLFFNTLQGQSLVKKFLRLSRPEKSWTIMHGLVAKKAWECAQQANMLADSLEKAKVLRDGQGGRLDAFRHAYWMALLVQEMTPTKAKKLGIQHERGNYLDFQKGNLEDGTRPDSIACAMDLFNNDVGIAIGLNYKSDANKNRKLLIDRILSAIQNGELRILKKDAEGHYLDCNDEPIDLALYKDKWMIPKCLILSNAIMVKE